MLWRKIKQEEREDLGGGRDAISDDLLGNSLEDI